jgi:prephenate dehydrogenase
LILKELRQVTVVGLGLLGASLSLSVLRAMAGVRVVGYSHRASTREKAAKMGVASAVMDDMREAAAEADILVLATPICTFKEIFAELRDSLKPGCVVTDVGSTKELAHRWAKQELPKSVYYVGSHPIAGSEQRGVEFARDDLFAGAHCIVTSARGTNKEAVEQLRGFWAGLGMSVSVMNPGKHDALLANISHLPHIAAAALVNANTDGDLQMAGRGFIDTSRVASGPANIWTDIVVTNPKNIARGIDRMTAELNKIKAAIVKEDAKRINALLEKARVKRAGMIEFKLKKKQML